MSLGPLIPRFDQVGQGDSTCYYSLRRRRKYVYFSGRCYINIHHSFRETTHWDWSCYRRHV